jgi:FMN phosphatase YigB (HAD superfamily)
VGRMLLQALSRFGFLPDNAIGLDHCLKAYGWERIPEVHLFPDVIPFLEILHQRGIKMGIVTNASQPMTLRDNELMGYDLMRFFPEASHRISAADVGYLKPHMAIFEHALKVLGTQPDETIFIGDNPVADIAGSQSAGMKAILRVLTPTRSMISGLIVPDAAINTFEELPSILDEWYPGRW